MIELSPANRDELLRDINLAARGVDIPPAFKPLLVPPADRSAALEHFDLPQEPDQIAEPDLHRFWTEMFSDPLEFHQGDLSYASPPTSNFQKVGAVAQQPRHQASRNWSGASITPRDGRMFTDVLATWIVPSVSVPLGGNPNVEYKSSCWVGLDGQRSYADSTLPQVGTEQGINKGGLSIGPKASVWIQWWPTDELTIDSLPVAFGDRVYCWITAVTFTRVRCIIKIAGGLGLLQRFYMNAPTIDYSPPPIPFHPARISGATAQWVTEAPTSKATKQIFPLPNYGQVDFEYCYAFSALGPLQAFHVERLIGPMLTDMYKVGGAPGRRVTISTATRPGIVPEMNVVRTKFVV